MLEMAIALAKVYEACRSISVYLKFFAPALLKISYHCLGWKTYPSTFAER